MALRDPDSDLSLPLSSSVPLYRGSLALLTDFYELTMGQALFSAEVHEQHASFDLFFRRAPYDGSFAICAGLAYVLDYLRLTRFTSTDLEFLSKQVGNDSKPLFSNAYLDYLAALEWSLSISAIPEGSVVFAHEPLICVSGPIIQCLLLESIALAFVNSATAVATKAARIKVAAKDDAVTEGGMRRAFGIGGALDAARNAYIGGFDGTSNTEAARVFGLKLYGTMAHALIQFFEDEELAFSNYAKALPHNVVFLVDTYNVEQGIFNAIKTAKQLEAHGFKAKGIRLDSGDLATDSIQARRLLDEAGLNYMQIIASNDLDEYVIESLKLRQGAKVTLWNVGTKVVSPPALGAVYKLSAVRSHNQWISRLKVSSEPAKTSLPGRKQVRRYRNNGSFLADVIFELGAEPKQGQAIKHLRTNSRFSISTELQGEDLLLPVMESGGLLSETPDLGLIRAQTLKELKSLPQAFLRLENPAEAFVGLSPDLVAKRSDLIERLSGKG